jgi:uncharacterized protein (DUF952 family)
MSDFLHITTRTDWEQAATDGEYRPASLDAEGFIHLSTPTQVVETANQFFRGQAGLVLLVIDAARLTVSLRWEPAPDRDGERFPHLYGPLNVAAVARAVDFAPNADGTFALPKEAAVVA